MRACLCGEPENEDSRRREQGRRAAGGAPGRRASVKGRGRSAGKARARAALGVCEGRRRRPRGGGGPGAGTRGLPASRAALEELPRCPAPRPPAARLLLADVVPLPGFRQPGPRWAQRPRPALGGGKQCRALRCGPFTRAAAGISGLTTQRSAPLRQRRGQLRPQPDSRDGAS